MKPGVFVRITVSILALVLIAPTVIVVATSFTEGNVVTFPPKGFSLQWYADIWSSPLWLSAFQNSFLVGILAAAFAALVGILLAFGAARGRGLLPRSLITTLALGPMIVPLVVAGVGLYMAAVHVGLDGTIVGLALAHSMIGVPYVFINVLAALTGVNREIEEAARIGGASQTMTLALITLPLITPAAAIGAILAFISSWDEVIIASFLNAPTFRTLPVVIFGEVNSGAQPSTSAASAIVTLVSIVLFLGVAIIPILRKKLSTMSKKNRKGISA